MSSSNSFHSLPLVLMSLIYTYLPKTVTVLLSKENYTADHHHVRQSIHKLRIEEYIRTMVSQNNDFVMKYLLMENCVRWLRMTNYYHKECIYTNYLFFLEYYALEHRSDKCFTAIRTFLEEQGLSKNQHKKNKIRYVKWKI